MKFIHENIVPASEILRECVIKKTAVGAFNFSNMEIIQAIVEAATEEKTNVILQASESAIKYMGMEYLISIVKAAANTTDIKIALHLDHGKDFQICKHCIDSGFSSVMIDKSSLEFDQNVYYTKEVVDYAKKHGVSVEAELGTLAGIEDEVNVLDEDVLFTNPESAQKFADLTQIDSLAVAIGTSHGPNKGKFGNPKLDIKRLSEIKQKVGNLPIVLHGASSVYKDVVDECNQYGASVDNAFGITDQDIKESIQNGVAKINVDTDIRLSFLAGLRQYLMSNPANIDMRKYLGFAKNLSKNIIKRKIQTFL